MSAASPGWAGRGAAYAVSEVHRQGPSLGKLAALLRPQASDRILDLGTGTGHTAAFLARWSGDVTGVDPEPDMLQAARTAYGNRHGLKFVHGSGERLPFGDASFDAVSARHTLHHHPDVRATLFEVARVLAPGGRFVLVDETPSDQAHAQWFDEIERARDPSHVSARSLAEWAELIAAAGLAWIVGDDRTRYRLDVGDWLDRMAATPETRAEVHRRFQAASPAARAAFEIEYQDDRPVRFTMPMNVVLAIKEES